MNDKTIALADQYDLKILRTYKGRGVLICETDKGLKQFCPYYGTEGKIELLQELLMVVKEAGFVLTDVLEYTKEGKLFVSDVDGSKYLIKDYIEGQECSVKSENDMKNALRKLAKIHICLQQPELADKYKLKVISISNEYAKHNKELKKVRNFIREKSQKTDFEVALMQSYDDFYKIALWVENRAQKEGYDKLDKLVIDQGSFCHGDYQYHNILFKKEQIAVINYEKCILGNKVRDIYLFMRKSLEKNSWSYELGKELLEAYEQVTPLNFLEKTQLYDRFFYPEKFWKVVNYYYNNGKSWISIRNMEKLNKIKEQEYNKELFLEQYARDIC